ncbi:hypothetical protein [Emticicia sp.]|uniref:hypothetical protein n=1 Tax=Emticicia sp. TaxID=1930953 RepID=UPI0037501F03
MKNCNSCHFSSYSGGQEGYSEERKIPLSRFSNIYCRNKITQGYKEKGETCNDFLQRTSIINQGIHQSKPKKT